MKTQPRRLLPLLTGASVLFVAPLARAEGDPPLVEPTEQTTPRSASAADMERAAHTEILIGAIVEGVGTLAAIVGIGLAFDAYSRGRPCDATLGCPNAPELRAGLYTTFASAGALVASIPFFVIGGHQLSKAHRQEAAVSVAPTAGEGLAARVTISF